MIRNRISSDIQDLNELHTKYWWIPDETMIRPTPKILEDKQHFSNYIHSFFCTIEKVNFYFSI